MNQLKQLFVYLLLGLSLAILSPVAGATESAQTESTSSSDSKWDVLLQILGQTGQDITNANDQLEQMASRDVVADVEGIFKSVLDGISQYSGQTREKFSEVAGQSLLGGLAIISLSLLGFKFMLEGGNLGYIMADLIQFAMKLGIAVLFLNEFMLWFDQYLFGSFQQLATMAMPNYSEFLPEKLFTAIPVNFIQLIASSFSNLFEQGWMTVFAKLLPTLIMTIFLSLLLLIASLISIVTALATFVMMQIGLAVGPIMIPFMVLRQTEFVFDGWLKFMISAGMTFLVISLLTGMMVAAMTSLMGAYTSQPGALGFSSLLTLHGLLPTLLAGTAIGMLTAHLMMKAPDIAQSLISGGSEGIGKLGMNMQTSGQRVGNNAHNLGATGVGAARAGASAASAGARAGATAASAGAGAAMSAGAAASRRLISAMRSSSGGRSSYGGSSGVTTLPANRD